LSTVALGVGTDTDGKPYTADVVSLIWNAPTAIYSQKDVTSATTITLNGFSLLGAAAANYTLQSSYVGSITPKSLTLTNATGLSLSTSKTYDGTPSATVSGNLTNARLLNTEAPGTGTTTDGKPYTADDVSLNVGATPTATFSQSNVGTGLTINYTGSALLTGASSSNYTVSSTASSSGVISPATASMAAAKTYDGTAAVSAGQLTVTGVNGESLNVSGTATVNKRNFVDNANNYISDFSGISLLDKTVGGTTYWA